jgi:hypothetical protein
MHVLLVSVIVFLLNIPFGYWRANVKKFSWQWVFAIHLSVPFIILLRIYTEIGFAWFTYLFLVSAFFLGHRIGALLHAWYLKNYQEVSSCLVMDFKKVLLP